MAEMFLMRCEYCGGTLVNVEGDQWICQNCGTSTIIKPDPKVGVGEAQAAPSGFGISVEFNGRSSSFKVREKAEFQIAFDRRATMADKFPTVVSLTVDGRPRGTFEHLPKSGKGSVIFEADGDSIVVYATGKSVIAKDGMEMTSDDEAEGTYIVAGLKVDIERTG